MNCEDLQHALLSGSDPDDDEIRTHTGECDACREFLALRSRALDLEAPPRPAPERDALQARVREALAEEQGLVAQLKAMPTLRRVGLGLTLAALVVLFEGTLLRRADFDELPRAVLLGLVLGLAALTVLGVRAVLRPLHEPELGRPARAVLQVLLLASPVVWSFLQPATDHRVSSAGAGADFWQRALGCSIHGLVLAGVMVSGLFLLDRRRLRSSFAPVLAGALGGVVAVMGLQLHCPIPTSAHWLIGHASVGLVVVAALAGYRKLRGDR